MSTRRSGVAPLAALCGIAIGVGALLPWMDARGPRPQCGITHTSVAGLFRWSYENASPYLRSFGAVILLAGVLVLLGGLAASRAVTGCFSLVALSAAGLWIGLNASHYAPTELPYSDLPAGAWPAVAGGLVGLLSAFLLRRRAGGRHAP
jgi:hypothetical protein